MAAAFNNISLLKKKGDTLENVQGQEALKGKRFYDKVKKAGCNFEVVLCSRDRTEPDLIEYFKDHNGNWLALPYGNNHMHELLKKYEVATIPALKILREDGKMVADQGRKDIQEKGINDPVALFKEWEKLAAKK